ncbi:MAG: UDP-2,3-diacylglucosamine diphosphatase [Bacteroidetes bacterium]|nr:UDP-2,3-diacylglucosamine diphosphatase [Bacteroidota bacterium]
MILFVSDLHFGQHDAATERAKEADLIRCLRAHEDDVDHLYLMGDVFNEYIEYRYLIPKGWIRFQGLVAAWTDAGTPVTYLAGNHDPWHRDYFSRELGVRMVYDAVIEPTPGPVVYCAHGDAVATQSSAYPWLRPWLRHPIPVGLYRALLPGDAGFRLARWVSRAIHKDEPDPDIIAALRDHAHAVVASTAATLAVMGHSHAPELITWAEGCYLNTGNWYESRTFGRLDDDGVRLLRWNGQRAVDIEAAQVPR